MVQRASLLDAIRVTWQQQHWVVAIMTGLADFGMPLIQLMVLLWVLGPLAAGACRSDSRGAMRFLGLLRPWSMVRVFLLGVVVSVVKWRAWRRSARHRPGGLRRPSTVATTILGR